MPAIRTAASERARYAPKGAIALLEADHEAVNQLFAAYEKSRSVPDKEEHDEIFPKVKASSLDMVDLGARMASRKGELLALAARFESEKS